jgi:uncharacterized membrane protein
MRLLMRNVLIGFMFWGCGSQRELEPKTPIPESPGQPSGKDFAQVTAITNQYCLRCHSTSPFLKSEAAWDASEAKARLTARSMPPGGTNEAKNLSDKDRSFLISF